MNNQYQRIIVVMPARLGDALFCTPALALLKKYYPHTQIDIIALSTVTAAMLTHNPAVTRVLINPTDTELQQLQLQYDLAINLHYAAISDVQLASLAPAWLSIGPHAADQHQSAQALTFIQQFLAGALLSNEQHQYQLYPQTSHYQRVQQLLTAQGVDPERDILIGCHLGCHRLAALSGWQRWRGINHKKVWPLKNFIKLETALRKQQANIRFVLTGSKSEQYLGQKFMRKVPQAINLIDKTSVLELAALMDSLHVYIASDTGALHVACATNVKLVALFGPTSVIRTGPYPFRMQHSLISQDNIRDIAVAEVAAAVIKHLS